LAPIFKTVLHIWNSGCGVYMSSMKQAKESSQEIKEMFNVISEQSLLGIAILQDNVIKYTNNAWSDITGFSIEEMCNWEPNEFIQRVHPDDRKYMMDQAKKKQANGWGQGSSLWLYVVNTLI
jgi:PAS domain S-box-containing protein